MIRAKFVVDAITSHSWNPNVKTVKLGPRYDTNIPEDKRFSDATPSGELTLTINNPAVIEQLTLGKAFYLDLVPVE